MHQGRLVFHPDAVEEGRAARLWYQERSAHAAHGFLSELSRSFSLIASDPEAWQVFPTGDRRFVLRNYPYVVVYRLLGEQIQVLAIAHQRRKPHYWKGR